MWSQRRVPVTRRDMYGLWQPWGYAELGVNRHRNLAECQAAENRCMYGDPGIGQTDRRRDGKLNACWAGILHTTRAIISRITKS